MTAPAASAAQRALLGDRELRPHQKIALAGMQARRNLLAVFGTGQGKSVLFQIPAIDDAIAHGRKTIIFQPLRALANDQYETIKRDTAALPVRILRANGSITPEERTGLDAALSDGSWDILFATPEFAMHHIDRMGAPHNRPDLAVLDEAHHLLESRHRSAYRNFGDILAKLGDPQTAAFTATAQKATFDHIVRTLGTDAWVINPTVRENLRIVDARNRRDKLDYVLDLAINGDGKMIVYCNSRKMTTQLAEAFEDGAIPGAAAYNAEMPTKKRREVEDAFRAGELRFIMATSAFGEGIDLPDVRNVVMFHLNFNMVAFNQMAGRAGRDGQEARIHLLYGEADRRINDRIMSKQCPRIEVLRAIYKGLKSHAVNREIRSTYVALGPALGIKDVDGGTIGTAAKIFSEVGLAEIGKDPDGRFIRLPKIDKPVDIESSERYMEGIAELEAFERFCRTAMREHPRTLETAISRPIYPAGIPLCGEF